MSNIYSLGIFVWVENMGDTSLSFCFPIQRHVPGRPTTQVKTPCIATGGEKPGLLDAINGPAINCGTLSNA
jgi:hypothetical protein